LRLRYHDARRWLGFVAFCPVRRRRRFGFAGKDYHYFIARYNTTWGNERAVELPVVLDQIRRGHSSILEVGNVLNHYVHLPHDVVDKYEESVEVINQDVLEFSPDKRYDLIVSISTLEHVGLDEDIRDAEKPVRTISHLRSLLCPGGTLFITFPLGYNPDLDQRLASGSLDFDEVRYLKRISRSNRWREVSAADVTGVRYGVPYPHGNAVAFATSNSLETPTGRVSGVL
jgi:hypothetical protein